MNIEDYCKFLNISKPTIYNWKKDKPNLYKIVMEYKEKNLNNLTKKDELIVKLFNELNEDEQEYFKYEMKTRILKNKLDKK